MAGSNNATAETPLEILSSIDSMLFDLSGELGEEEHEDDPQVILNAISERMEKMKMALLAQSERRCSGHRN